MENYDFSGWATRNDLLCSDGRTIRRNAFKDCDGKKVPLVYNHEHNDPNAVLGHALLENRDEGVYAYCKFNDTEQGKVAKQLVQHGDVRSLSIWANKLQQFGSDVVHGVIRELSLVLAGANDGAYIDFVMAHGEDGENELYANYDENAITIYHSDENEGEEVIEHAAEPKESKSEDSKDESKEKKETVQDIYETMNEKQKLAVCVIIDELRKELSGKNDSKEETKKDSKEETKNENKESEGGDKTMKHNVFENDKEVKQENVLTHSDMEAIFKKGKSLGSLKEGFLAHTGDDGGVITATKPTVWGPSSAEATSQTQNYGVYDPQFLFPEARTLNTPPEFIKRDTGWVAKVMGGVHHTPFSRIKSMFADITGEEARARGYIKGKLKKEEVFGLLKRTTTPTTIYKKQKMDRDDVNDITSFDVVAWIKGEMRVMLDEELARAFLVGDGRDNSNDDKISELNIRPIWKDEDLFTIKKLVTYAAGATDDQKAKEFIRAAIKARKDYKGSGEPTLYTTEDVLTDCLLIEDSTGRVIYDTIEKLKHALRVKDIVTVPVMEGITRTDDDGKKRAPLGIIVNLKDYNVGADKGGAINMFEDFDIDYNQQKYLIETRCSGALIKPYSAIALEVEVTE